jgi:hypothetical protein
MRHRQGSVSANKPLFAKRHCQAARVRSIAAAMQTWDLVRTLKIEGVVHLQKLGWILLAGDAVQLQDNWDNRRTPYFSTTPPEQKLQTLLSMQRLAGLTNFYDFGSKTRNPRGTN